MSAHPCGCIELTDGAWAMCGKHYADGKGPVEHLVKPPSPPSAFALPPTANQSDAPVAAYPCCTIADARGDRHFCHGVLANCPECGEPEIYDMHEVPAVFSHGDDGYCDFAAPLVLRGTPLGCFALPREDWCAACAAEAQA